MGFMLSISAFINSLSADRPPENINDKLVALWYDGNGDWERAHEIAQSITNKDGALIHAYLHRKEGDIGNAYYWYARAGSKMPQNTADDEWLLLVKHFLQ